MRKLPTGFLRNRRLIILSLLALGTCILKWCSPSTNSDTSEQSVADAKYGSSETEPIKTTVTVTVTNTVTVTIVEKAAEATRVSNIPAKYEPYYERIEKAHDSIPHSFQQSIPNLILRTWKTNNRVEIMTRNNLTLDSNRTSTNTCTLADIAINTTEISASAVDPIPLWFQSWDVLNPTHVQLIFNDDDSDRFVRGFFSTWIIEAYFKLPRIVMRSDFVRYLMLYKFGGVYTDMDTLCMQPIYTWTFGLKNISLIVGVENARGKRDNINQWTIGSAQHHPFMAMLIHRVAQKIHESTEEQLRDTNLLLYLTGPGIWKPAVHDYLAELGATIDQVSFVWDGYRVFGDTILLGKTHLSSSNEYNPKTFSRHFGTGKLKGGWKTTESFITGSDEALKKALSFQYKSSEYEPQNYVEVIQHKMSGIQEFDSGTLIPKNIAQVYYSTNQTLLNGKYLKFRESWQKMNPHYVYTLYDDAMMDAFIRLHGSETDKKAFFKLSLVHHRYIFFKFFWLVKVGGVFVDVDTECLRPIHKWKLDWNMHIILGMQDQTTKPPEIASHTILATPNHKFLKSYISDLKQFILPKPKKLLRQVLPFKTLHKEWFNAHVIKYFSQGIESLEGLGFERVSWEGMVSVGDVGVYGQAWFRPDDLDRDISCVKNFGTLWHGEVTWSTEWPELAAASSKEINKVEL